MKDCQAAYDEFKFFKSQILLKAMKEVNDVSNIKIKEELKRTGRKVTPYAVQCDAGFAA